MAVAEAPANNWARGAIENETALMALRVHILSKPDLLATIDRAVQAHSTGKVITPDDLDRRLFG